MRHQGYSLVVCKSSTHVHTARLTGLSLCHSVMTAAFCNVFLQAPDGEVPDVWRQLSDVSDGFWVSLGDKLVPDFVNLGLV